ncbi:MAG: PLDc N-terminal domain-containing protein, partial [Oscillibacter sp.]|nr:PLDc N-terminal domain-containing protein [Oscillibacter sp.]
MKRRKISRKRERTERRISAALSLTVCALTLVVQIALTLLLTYLLREKANYAYAVLRLIGAVVAVRVYQRNGSPSYKLSWMCLLLILPVAGMILFLLWGGTHQAKQLSLKAVEPIAERESARMRSETNLSRLSREDPAWGRLATYLQKRGFLLYRNTQVQYFSEGADYLRDLTEHLRSAETYVFLEYYILAEGEIWSEIL